MGSVREERAFWAHQLHANLLNSIGAAIVQSQVCERAVRSGLSSSLEETLRLKRMLYELEDNTRSLVRSASDRHSLELVNEVQRLMQQFGQQYPSIPLKVAVSGSDRRIPKRVTSGVAAVLSEAISNSAKHAFASSIEVDLSLGEGSILLRIRDNGRGFNAQGMLDQVKAAPVGGRYGLAIMQERADSIGGKLAVSSVVGRGTQVTLHVPLPGPSVEVLEKEGS